MARPRWRSLAITAVKSAVAIVVLWAVGRHVLRTYSDLRGRSESLHFEPLWLTIAGRSLSGWTARIRRFLRAYPAIEPGARGASSGVASLHREPPGQVRARQGNGCGCALGDGRSVRRAGIDGGDRHILRNTGDDGRRGPGRRGRVRRRDPERTRSSSTLWGLGPVELPVYRIAALHGAWSRPGVSGRRAATGLRSCGGPGHASHSRVSVAMRCLASRDGSWARGFSGPAVVGSCSA